jgi:hypothetical protein
MFFSGAGNTVVVLVTNTTDGVVRNRNRYAFSQRFSVLEQYGTACLGLVDPIFVILH